MMMVVIEDHSIVYLVKTNCLNFLLSIEAIFLRVRIAGVE